MFAIQWEVAGKKRFYDSLKGRMAKYGRKPESLKIFYGVQPIVGETEEIAQAKAALHNSMVSAEAGFVILSGHLAYDLSREDPNATIEGLTVPGVQGLADMYKTSSSGRLKTLKDIAAAHARGVSVPQIVGTGAQIADWMESVMTAVGGDGFLLSPVYVPGSTEEFVEMVVPELQRRGLVRQDYIAGTLRDNLMDF